MAGRGFGKTRTGAETVAWWAYEHPGARIAVVGPTWGDVDETMIDGESGLIAVLPESCVAEWTKTKHRVRLANGSTFRGFSAGEYERLRGPQFWFAWADELGAWEHGQDALDLLLLALRLGPRPRLVCTTTPRLRPAVVSLVKSPTTHLTHGSTYDNLANLAPTFAAEILSRYSGSRYERQEIFGELLEDVEGALWTLQRIDALRVENHPELLRCVVGVDPAGGGRDETGIVVAARGPDGHGYVLSDRSGRFHPEEWARRAIGAYREHRADHIVAERNYGGEMVEHTIRAVDASIPVRLVTATRGKVVRAEPIATLYQQGRVHHVGVHRALEDQLVMWTPASGYSPDRMDALVWALTDIMEGSSASAYLAQLVAERG